MYTSPARNCGGRAMPASRWKSETSFMVHVGVSTGKQNLQQFCHTRFIDRQKICVRLRIVHCNIDESRDKTKKAHDEGMGNGSYWQG